MLSDSANRVDEYSSSKTLRSVQGNSLNESPQMHIQQKLPVLTELMNIHYTHPRCLDPIRLLAALPRP